MLDVGSAIVDPTQHSNRDAMTNPRWIPTGLDIEPGLNVDVAVADPYDWREVESGSIDVVTCSEVFEHAEYFWVTIHEIARVLRPNGLAFITSPSSGPLHRYPVDCWRFYDDGLPAVARYGGLSVLRRRCSGCRSTARACSGATPRSCCRSRPIRRSSRGGASEELGRQAHSQEALEATDFASPPPAPSAEPSVIGALAGKGAFAAREQELAREAGSARRAGRPAPVPRLAAHDRRTADEDPVLIRLV